MLHNTVFSRERMIEVLWSPAGVCSVALPVGAALSVLGGCGLNKESTHKLYMNWVLENKYILNSEYEFFQILCEPKKTLPFLTTGKKQNILPITRAAAKWSAL